MRGVALFVAFLLESFAIGALSYAGFRLPIVTTWNYILGIGLPLVVILFWWRYMAPKSSRRLKNPYYLFAKAIIFVAASLFLAAIGKTTAAILFAVIAILDEIILTHSNMKI